MAAKVLDSWALMAFFGGEPAAPAVEQILLKAETTGQRLLLCVVNWGEVYYAVMRATNQVRAETIARELSAMAIDVVPIEADLHLVRQAAMYKATQRLSYADAFAAALARIRKAELITGDLEFKSVAAEIKIHWLQHGGRGGTRTPTPFGTRS